jgi:protease-4
MSDEAVEEVARGRVWSGKAAVENGLVDELGGFQDAIARARSEAGISKRADVTLVSFQGGGGLLGAMAPEVIRALLPEAAAIPQALPGDELLPYLRLADEPVLALLPWVLEVH